MKNFFKKMKEFFKKSLTNHETIIENQLSQIKKECKSFRFTLYQRRERDSNPRYLAVQRFSRPPQSTTLPSLQNSHTRVLVFKSDAKLRLIFESASVWTTFFHLRLFFIWKQLLTLFSILLIKPIYKLFIFAKEKKWRNDWTFRHDECYYDNSKRFKN